MLLLAPHTHFLNNTHLDAHPRCHQISSATISALPWTHIHSFVSPTGSQNHSLMGTLDSLIGWESVGALIVFPILHSSLLVLLQPSYRILFSHPSPSSGLCLLVWTKEPLVLSHCPIKPFLLIHLILLCNCQPTDALPTRDSTGTTLGKDPEWLRATKKCNTQSTRMRPDIYTKKHFRHHSSSCLGLSAKQNH